MKLVARRESETPVSGPVPLIPARRQTLWGVPAVANFALGGTGAGVYAATAVVVGLGSSPSLTIASWLGPALVLAGFAAVAAEAGRPLRGPRVLRRLSTSWMSRELALGLLFALFAAAEFVMPSPLQRLAALAAALGLVLAQGLILYEARGVAAWSVRTMPLVFLASAAVAGAGLMVVLDAASGAALDSDRITGAITLVPVAGLVWLVYISPADPAFVEATRALREGPGVFIFLGGYVAPVALLALAQALGGEPVSAALGGGLLLAGQSYAKAVLILRCGQLRPITVDSLRFVRRVS